MGYVLTYKGSSLLGSASDKGGFYHDGTYLWVLIDSTHLAACTFDGTNFSVVGSSLSFITNYYSYWIYGDGTYVYVKGFRSGYANIIQAYRMKSDLSGPEAVGSCFNLRGANADPQSIWCGPDGYIYVTSSYYLQALRFNGSIFIEFGYDSPDWSCCNRIIGDGTYIYLCVSNVNAVRAYTFNGSLFTLRATYVGANGNQAYHDGTYLYFNDSTNLKALHIVGGNLVQAGNSYANCNLWGIYSDGYFIYVYNRNTYRMEVLTFDGTNFHPISSISDSGPSSSTSSFCHVYFRSPYVYYVSSTYAKAARMDLTAQFTADKLTGVAPLTINFNVIP